MLTKSLVSVLEPLLDGACFCFGFADVDLRRICGLAFALLGSVLVLELLELELLTLRVARRRVFCFVFGCGTRLQLFAPPVSVGLLLLGALPGSAASEFRVTRVAVAGLLRAGMALGTSSQGERYSKSLSPSNSICPSAFVSIPHLNSGVCCGGMLSEAQTRGEARAMFGGDLHVAKLPQLGITRSILTG